MNSFTELFTEAGSRGRGAKFRVTAKPKDKTITVNNIEYTLETTAKTVSRAKKGENIMILGNQMLSSINSPNRQSMYANMAGMFVKEQIHHLDKLDMMLLLNALLPRMQSIMKSKPFKREYLKEMEEAMNDDNEGLGSEVVRRIGSGKIEDIIRLDKWRIYPESKSSSSSSGSIDRKESWDEVKFDFAGKTIKFDYNFKSSGYDNNYYGY